MTGSKHSKGHKLFEPVNSVSIRHNLRQAFSDGFLTLISIVLGVALAVLAERLNQAQNFSSVRLWIHASTAFLNITGTFYFYYFFISLIAVRPSFFQVLVPFLLGSSVIYVAYRVGSDDFWIANVVCWLIAIICFSRTNNISYYDPKDTSSRAIRLLTRGEGIKNAIFFASMSTLTTIVILSSWIAEYVDRDILLFICNCTLYLVCVAWTEHNLRKLYDLISYQQ